MKNLPSRSVTAGVRASQVAGLGAIMCLFAVGGRVMGDDTTVSFRRDIAPILLESCLACHGPKKAEGGYRVDTYDELLKAGDSGVMPIAASPDEVNELLRRITCEDEFERMPAESEPLAPEQVELFKQWIAAGATFDGGDTSESLELVIPPPQYAAPPEVYARAVPITATAFSPDGKSIVTGGYHEILVWDAAKAQLVRRISNVGQRVFGMAFSPDGKSLAVGCGEPGRSGEVRLVNFQSGEITAVLARTNDVVLDVAYRPNSNELAVASADSTIRIIDTQTQAELRTIASHADWVTAVAWSDDGNRLVSASRDKTAKTYDGATGELLSSYSGHGAAVRGVSVLADNQQAASVGADGKLHRWRIEGAKKVAEVGIGGEGYKLTRKGSDLFVPCADKRLLQIDLNRNAVAREYKGHHDWVLSACCQPAADGGDGPGQIVSGSFDGEVCLWNIADAVIVDRWIAKP